MNTKLFNYLKVGISIILLTIFISIPTSVFETGKSICIYKNLFNIECFGCGLTRAFSYIFHFEFEKAYASNKLCFLILFLLGIIYIKTIILWLKK